MNTALHSHIGASKSSISTMSTIGNGATNADGATKTIKNPSNIENDDPNNPANNPSVSKSKEQPQDASVPALLQLAFSDGSPLFDGQKPTEQVRQDGGAE